MMSVRLLILYLILPAAAYSQTEIKGTVFDAESGESLPSATVIIENSFKGTITNNQGQFSITADNFPITLRFSYIGYETQSVEVQNPPDTPVLVQLIPSVTELEAIVVTDRDPGLSIMEKVIERKKLWRADLNTYQSMAYTRQVLENDTSIVSISESESISYWDREKGHREVQTSAQQTSNISADQNFAGVSYLPNFYDDNILIAGYNMVGITHPDALRYYHFSLLETLQMDGIPVFKIKVSPKRQRQPTFTGTAFVLDREYALIEVDLKPNDVVNFPPPIREFDLAYKQQFNNFGGDFWLPVDMRVDGNIRIGMIGLRFPSMKFRQLSRLTDYQVNNSLPDSVFEDQNSFSQVVEHSENTNPDDTAGILDSEPDSLAEAITVRNAIPLTKEEKSAYAEIDSTQTLEEAFKPEGFLANMMDDDEDNGNSGFLSGVDKFFPKGTGLKMRFNRADGFHLGARYKNRFNFGFQFETYGGYSFNSKMWDYGIHATQQILQKNDTKVSLLARYDNSTRTQYESNLYSTGLQSFSAFIGGDDYSDYYRNERISAGFGIENVLPKVHLQLSANHENHRSFEPDSDLDFSLFGWHRPQRINPQIEEGNLRSFTTTLSYGDYNPGRDFGFSGSRNISVSAEISDPSYGSDFNFTKITFSGDWNFPTFYQRRLFTNTLDVHFSGGYTFGDLPIQRFGTVDGSLTRFTPFGSLKTRKYLPYQGDKYWAAAAEHNFRTIPFEILGINALVDRGWSIILFGGAGYSASDSIFRENLLTSDGIHTEAGISLNSVFGILRIDFAKRLDSPGSFIGLSVPRYF